jgi:hypothetical protein
MLHFCLSLSCGRTSAPPIFIAIAQGGSLTMVFAYGSIEVLADFMHHVRAAPPLRQTFPDESDALLLPHALPSSANHHHNRRRRALACALVRASRAGLPEEFFDRLCVFRGVAEVQAGSQTDPGNRSAFSPFGVKGPLGGGWLRRSRSSVPRPARQLWHDRRQGGGVRMPLVPATTRVKIATLRSQVKFARRAKKSPPARASPCRRRTGAQAD